MPKPCEVNIIGGKFRSRKITFPELPELRPTPNRIRETLFDWLQQDPVGAHCLDAFAGSGALGFEALSRGADSVVFLEKDRAVFDALTRNADNLKVTAQIEVIQQNSLDWLSRANTRKPFNLVFLDPPFGQPWLVPCLEFLLTGNWLAPKAWVYIESPQPLDTLTLPKDFEVYRHKKAGQVHYGLLR